jgi:thymidylate kinase
MARKQASFNPSMKQTSGSRYGRQASVNPQQTHSSGERHHAAGMKRGLVIALSGVDCAGKSTQRDRLMELLRSLGYTPVNIYMRAGYTPVLDTLKRSLHLGGSKRRDGQRVAKSPGRFPRRAANLRNPLQRWAWLTLALLDLVLQQCTRARWMRARGGAVVCNRYLLDALVDFRVNFPNDAVERRLLCRLLRRWAARPDVAFCLLVPARVSAARAQAKGRFHRETADALERRKCEYERLAGELGVALLDGELPAEEIALSIRRAVERAITPEAKSR